MQRKNRLTLFIVIALVAGILTGYIYRAYQPDEKHLQGFSDNISILTDIFLRLIKMIIAPLVFTTLIVGIAKVGDIKSVGRIGGKTLLWFISASFVSLFIGLILVNIFKPGVQLNLVSSGSDVKQAVSNVPITFRGFVTHIFPTSIINAMANNEILQIVMFALFFGIALAAVGETGKQLIKALDAIAQVMLKVTDYVMRLAPLAVFAALAGIVATKGIGVLWTYGKFIAEFYLGLIILWSVVLGAGSLFIKRRITELVKRIIDPLVLAFSTASSEAAFPKLMEQLERFGCKNKIVSFVLPVGYSFNLDGSMMYMTFASLFIAQAYGIHLSFEKQFTMLLVLMITSKGIAGVPRAALVVVAASLSLFNIPAGGLLLLLGIDHLLDMGRTATNVVGNAVATAVVSKWENELASSTDSME
jgi:Na+/H+-dicarboxylate symporter